MAHREALVHSIRRWLYLGLAGVYLMGCFTEWIGLKAVFTVLLLVALLLAFPDSKKDSKAVGSILLGMGILCLIFVKADAAQWNAAFSANGGLVVLFITLPLFGILLSFNDYIKTMGKLFHIYVRKGFWFFSLASVMAGVLGSVTNLGGITLTHELLQPHVHHYGNERQFAQALSRGNLSMSYWAPCHMSVATVVTYTGISWLELAPRGLLLSLLQLLMISFLFYAAAGKEGRKTKGLPMTGAPEKKPESISQRDQGILLQLFAIYIGLISLVAVLNWKTSLPILAIISLVAVIYPFLVSLLMRQLASYLKDWSLYFKKKLPGIVNQVVLFASVGFFGKAVEISGLGDRLIGLLHLEAWASPFLLTAGIALTMVLLSLIGIHPIVCMITLASTLKPELLGMSALSLAYTYLLGYSVGVIVSPFSAVALTVSALNGRDPWNGLSRHNLMYGMLIIIFFSLIIPWL